jgi:integrase
VTRRSPGAGSFYKRRTKTGFLWVGSVTLPSVEGGKQDRKTVSAKNRGAAMRKWRELQSAVADGLLSASPNMTVGRWLDYWLTEIRGPSVRPKTREFYGDVIRLHIKPAVGHRKLGQLTAVHVRDMLAGIESTKTRQRAHLVIRLALKSAVTERLIRHNVTDAIPKPGHAAKQICPFDAETAAHIIAVAFDRYDETMATRWAAAFLTGARQGELLGLRWSHVDLANGTIELAWQLQQLDQVHGCGSSEATGSTAPACGRSRPGWCPKRRWAVPDGFPFVPLNGSLALTRPKSAAGYRVVPLVAPLAAAMRRLHVFTAPNRFDLVWAQPDGSPIQPRADHRAWKTLLVDAGVADAPLHAARHTTATLLQAGGVDEDTRMRICGHSSATAHRGYVHVSQQQARAAMDASLAVLMPAHD